MPNCPRIISSVLIAVAIGCVDAYGPTAPAAKEMDPVSLSVRDDHIIFETVGKCWPNDLAVLLLATESWETDPNTLVCPEGETPIRPTYGHRG